MNVKTTLRGVVAAAALAAASLSAHADIHATLDFDSVASGTTANAYLASLGLQGISFGNGDIAYDLDAYGNALETFHWVDASATYGDVLVKNDGTAVSGTNVLWNDHQAILVQFSAPVNITSFSVQQDSSDYGSFQGVLSFLDSTGHVIAGADVSYVQFGQPGLLISSGPVAQVSAILLPALKSYDNLSINAVTPAVPEPSTWALALASLAVVGVVARRRG
jgi:hypothetical protein